MAQEKKVVITNSGTEIRLNDIALRIAERHFGVRSLHPTAKETPIELLKLPKDKPIIKAAPVLEQLEQPVIIPKEKESISEPEPIKEKTKVVEKSKSGVKKKTP